MENSHNNHFLKFKSRKILSSTSKSYFFILHTLITHNTLYLIYITPLLLTSSRKSLISKKEYLGHILTTFLDLFDTSQVAQNFTCNILSKLHTR